tara:strand:+ start:116 stop:664 length:549 start_codon:yes stop_codon:yes gene_type:complete
MLMSSKLLKLRLIIFFWKIFGKINSIRSRNELNWGNAKNNKILIVFPIDEPSFRVACYTFRDLGRNNINNKQFIFIVRKEFKDLFHLHFGYTLYIEYVKQGTILLEEKSLIDLLKQNIFDYIIDLNPYFQLSIARFISLLQSEIKVGFLSEFSDNFYNIQLDVSKTGIMEKGFKQINGMLNQ